MPEVTIYTKDYCPYCVAAKELLASKGVAVREIDLSGDSAAMAELVERTGHLTVPQIFIGSEFIGGCDDLRALEAVGQLDAKLAGA